MPALDYTLRSSLTAADTWLLTVERVPRNAGGCSPWRDVPFCCTPLCLLQAFQQ